ncbi:MAG: Tim44/TimA family putative adaptor protein [Alphaproteobacteria bacterium]|nr:Tim44/TimA family putative adaptor protein [Alphaproteobacteria bacterium]
MGEGHLLDIIFLAMVAGFIFFRLRGVLGRRTGNEPRPDQQPDHLSKRAHDDDGEADDNVVSLSDRGRPVSNDDDPDSPPPPPQEDDAETTNTSQEEEAALWAEDSPVGAGLTKIKLADHNFEPSTFTEGARGAYEMIVDAFANGNRDALRSLLNDQTYENFVGAIEDREDKGHTLETTIVSLNAAEIVDAELKDKVAEVTIKFVSEMVAVTRDEDGEMLSDQLNGTHEVTDIWTFARDTRNRDPNWQLIETHGEN